MQFNKCEIRQISRFFFFFRTILRLVNSEPRSSSSTLDYAFGRRDCAFRAETEAAYRGVLAGKDKQGRVTVYIAPPSIVCRFCAA
jgi:hypothetical protein